MEVRKDYHAETQNSELGPIPADWRAVRFDDVLTGFTSGATPYRGRPEYFKGNIRWITSGELNYNTITDTVEKITEAAVRNTNLKILPAGTFLMAITGLEAAGTRGSCGIVGKESTTNQSCMALMPKNGEIITEYLYHFYVKYGDELAFRYCQGTKQQSYTGKIVKILPINLPPTLTEQRAIAAALSDADALLAALERLIAKKKAIKQGAMQELLTGRRRLEGKWNIKKLGDECDLITKGTTPTSLGREFTENGVTFIKIESLGENGEIIPEKVAYIDYHTNILLKRSQLKSEDILFSIAGALGRIAIVKNQILPANTNQALAIVRLKNDSVLDLRYLYWYLNSNKIQSHILTVAVQGAQPNLSLLNIYDLPIEYPLKEKQQEIAQILTDMDAEIAALEQQRDKYKAVKQGMMQELLTGKTRLV